MTTMKLALTICMLSLLPSARADIDIAFYRQENDDLSLYSTIPLNAIRSVTFCAGQINEVTACQRLERSDFKLAEQVDFVVADQDVMHYRASKQITSLIEWSQGIAVINADDVIPSVDSFVAVAGNKRYTIKRCAGVEGINLDLFDGERKLRNLYFYLGYDTIPTC